MNEEQPYKRFLLFGYNSFYPAGGSGDVVDSFATLEEAKVRMRQNGRDFFDVLDFEKRMWIDCDA